MKKTLLLFAVFLWSTVAFCQKTYTTSGMEVILSSAQVSINGSKPNTVVRFTPFFNFQTLINHDVSESFGVFTGLGIRNVGFIYDDPDNAGTRKKVRNYYVGIPAGVKIGNLGGMFLYGGYELELPINYKEKTFVNEEKTNKFNVWFSDRTQLQNTLFIGIQFPYGANIKFKYYLNNFYKQSYTEGGGNKPYENFEANMWYVSLNFSLFRNAKFYYVEMD